MSENDKNVIQKKEETEQEMQTPIHDSQEEIVVSINLPAESSVSYTKSKSSSNSNTTSTSSKSNLPNYISKLKPIILPNLTENFKTPRPPLKEKTFEKSNEIKCEVNLTNSDNKKTPNNEINRISSKKVLNIPRLTSSDSEIAPIKSDFFQNHLDSHKIAKIRSTKNFNLRKINLQNLESLDEYNKTSPKIKFPAINVFENENFVTFSDSNSPDDDPTQSIKATGINMKKFLTKDIKCKDIEIRHSSLLSVPSTICRICQTNTANEKLLSPCYCKGSLAYVHLSCLERWLNQSSRSYCELCLYQYNAVATLRYGLFEGIRLWIKHPRNRNHVRSDCLIAFLLTLITLGLLIICLMGMDYFMIEGIKLGFSKLWTKSFIVSFLAVIMLGYIVTIYLIAKDQFVPWYNWWKNTLNIHLVINQNMQQSQRL